jgi:hypothetical protein
MYTELESTINFLILRMNESIESKDLKMKEANTKHSRMYTTITIMKNQLTIIF